MTQQKVFVSIIWGYHKQFFGFSKVQNYQLNALRLAKEAGYKTIGYMISPTVRIQDDPHFDPETQIVKYDGLWQMIRFLWINRHALVYANSVIWQNFLLVPLFCRKTVFMAHDSIIRRSRLKQFIETAALRFYWRIRVIAPGEKEFLVRQGIASGKIFVVPIAIDTYLFKPNITPGNDIVYLGNVTPDNDLPTILRAFAQVHMNKPKIKLHIIGEIRIPEFHELVDHLGIRSSIKEHGYIPHSELSRLLPTFAIFVNSAISSGQHLSVYEAALSGLALCLPNTIQFNTVFTDCALFHSLYNPDQLAINLNKYLENIELAHDHNIKARKLIIHGYTEMITDKKLDELFSFK